MRYRALLAVLCVPTLILACGGETGGPLKGDPVSLNSLNGTYDIQELESCAIVVDESTMRLQDCAGSDDDGDPYAVTGSGTLTDELVSATGTATWSGSCYDYETRVEMSASKLEDRVDEGIFSSFAGTWDGSISFSWTETAKESGDCFGESQSGVESYTFDANIRGQSITLDTHHIEDDYTDTHTISGTSDRIVAGDEGTVERR